MNNVVKQADEVMNQLMHKTSGRTNPKTGRPYPVKKLTTSQIRKFLIAVNTVTNKINVYKSKNLGIKELSPELEAEVQYLKVKIVYQAGREAVVREFVTKAKILECIDEIGSDIKEYEKFARYIEALVAYHKFYGGQD